MDDEMIDRCIQAAWVASNSTEAVSDSSLPLNDAKLIAVAVIKAMLKPTEKMKKAARKYHAETEADDCYPTFTYTYFTMINAIINE